MSETDRRTRSFYDEEASRYDEIRYASRGGQRVDQFHHRVLTELSDLKQRRNDSVLEIGCGTGRLLSFFAPQVRQVAGIDASDGMLGVAERRLAELDLANVTIATGDALNLAFEDQSFDLVYSILVINLIPDYGDVFKEVRRVLRSDGTFLFNVPNMHSVYYPAGQIVNRRGKAFGSNASGHRYSHWFSLSEIDSALAGAGLTRTSALGQPPWTRLFDDAAPLPDSRLGRFLAKSLYISATPN